MLFRPPQILAGDRRNAVSALGDVKRRTGGRNHGDRRWDFYFFGGIVFHVHQLDAVRILYPGRRQGQGKEQGKEARAGQNHGEQEGSRAWERGSSRRKSGQGHSPVKISFPIVGWRQPWPPVTSGQRSTADWTWSLGWFGGAK